MSKIRVLICDPGCNDLLAELLGEFISRTPGMKCVGRSNGGLDLLVRLRRKGKKRRRDRRARTSSADVVLLLTRRTDEPPGVCTHVLAEHPDVLLIALPTRGAAGVVYRRSITDTPATFSSIGNLLRAIRLVDDDPPRGAP